MSNSLTPVSPGCIFLREFMHDTDLKELLTWEQVKDALHLSTIELVDFLGGLYDVTDTLAARLGTLTGTTEKFWINLQNDYRSKLSAEHAEQHKASAMDSIQILLKQDTWDLVEIHITKVKGKDPKYAVTTASPMFHNKCRAATLADFETVLERVIQMGLPTGRQPEPHSAVDQGTKEGSCALCSTPTPENCQVQGTGYCKTCYDLRLYDLSP